MAIHDFAGFPCILMGDEKERLNNLLEDWVDKAGMDIHQMFLHDELNNLPQFYLQAKFEMFDSANKILLRMYYGARRRELLWWIGRLKFMLLNAMPDKRCKREAA